jgi:hypothetical protein
MSNTRDPMEQPLSGIPRRGLLRMGADDAIRASVAQTRAALEAGRKSE